jgi:hypothetical protein
MVPGSQVRPQWGKSYLHVFILKQIFSRTSRPISIKLYTYHLLGKGRGDSKIDQIKGQVLFKGEIITKMGWGHLKIFSRTTEPE